MRQSFRAYVQGFVQYSLYTTTYLGISVAAIALILLIPGVKPWVRAKLKHNVDRLVDAPAQQPPQIVNVPTPPPAQDNQLHEAIRQQMSHLKESVEASNKEVRRTLRSNTGRPIEAPIHRPIASSPVKSATTGMSAEVRILPYPFHAYVSVASDPDGMKLEDRKRIHQIIHDEYQLKLSDQIFIATSRLSRHWTGLELEIKNNAVSPVEPDGFYELLAAHRHGAIEGIHGWHADAFASTESSFRHVAANPPMSHRVKVSGMERYDSEDHNYVVFEYLLPQVGSYCELKTDVNTIVPVRSQVDGAAGMETAMTWTSMIAELPPGTVNPELEFKLYGSANAYLEVRNLMITNFPRTRVEAEAQFLDQHNLRFLFYSEHGRGRNELLSGMRINWSNEVRQTALTDNPSLAPIFYMMPHFEQVGVTFLNAAHHTSQASALPITSLIHPLRFNDGIVRYNFKRYMCGPKSGEGTHHPLTAEMSWEPWLGFHLDRLLRNCARPGDGGVVYTHWGITNSPDGPLGELTKQQLEMLQERFYNRSGDTPDWQRVWVAPVAEVLLFSRAMQKVRDNAWYDETTNTIQIQSWYDDVSRQNVPWTNTAAFGLANLTFYVKSSSTARLTIDGREYTCLKRNGPDHTGRESITIVDDFTPTVVLDEVDPLQKFGDVESENAACYFRHKGGFRGSKCLEMQLEDSQGSSTWTIPALSNDHTDTIRFAYRKSNPESRTGLRILFEDQSSVEITEGQLSANQPGWEIPSRNDNHWHDVVVDLVSMQIARPFEKLPRGKVKSITLLGTNGVSGDSFFFDSLEFLRNPIHPPNDNRRVLVAGRVDPPKDGVKVVLDDGQLKQETVSNKGYFFFPEAAVRGATVTLYAETDDKLPRYPLSGRYIELRANEVDLTIPLGDMRDANLSRKLEKTFKAVSELNSEVGRIYQPHSTYIHSGIGKPQEYENKLQINNLGFLDRDRRTANPDQARRILFLGNCNLFGHSTPRSWHGNVLLEDQLTRATGVPTEVITFADSSMSFGKHWSYYNGLGRKFKPDLVCIFVHSSGVELLETDPDIFARFYEYAPDRFPCTLFRSKPDGSLKVIEPDPEYFQHIGKDEKLHQEREEEKKKGGYYTAGVDWLSVYYRKDWEKLPPAALQAWNHFARVLEHYRSEFARDGAHLMLVMTPEAQRMYGGTQKDFQDTEGCECNSKLLNDRMEKLCKSLGVGFFNLTPYIEQNYPDPGMYIWRYDAHPSPNGFQMIANGVQSYLLSTNFCRLLPSDEPKTSDQLLSHLSKQKVR